MADSRAPIYLYLAFSPEGRTTPTDGADVLQSVDDMYRLAERFQTLYPDVRGLMGGLRGDRLETFVEGFWLGHADSPVTAAEFRFGSPLELVTEVPWEVYVSAVFPFWLSRIEWLWHMRKRIAVESARLDAEKARHEREKWDELAEGALARERYWLHRRGTSARHLQGPVDEPGFIGIDGAIFDQRPELPMPRQPRQVEEGE